MKTRHQKWHEQRNPHENLLEESPHLIKWQLPVNQQQQLVEALQIQVFNYLFQYKRLATVALP
jgi:hypothetical protein